MTYTIDTANLKGVTAASLDTAGGTSDYYCLTVAGTIHAAVVTAGSAPTIAAAEGTYAFVDLTNFGTCPAGTNLRVGLEREDRTSLAVYPFSRPPSHERAVCFAVRGSSSRPARIAMEQPDCDLAANRQAYVGRFAPAATERTSCAENGHARVLGGKVVPLTHGRGSSPVNRSHTHSYFLSATARDPATGSSSSIWSPGGRAVAVPFGPLLTLLAHRVLNRKTPV